MENLKKIGGDPLGPAFFSRDVQEVAKELLGKVLVHQVDDCWLAARIIETEAYYQDEKGSHASEGYTDRRKALFMQPGTIYMYYARGKDSFNVSCHGEGNAVLVKAGIPYLNKGTAPDMVERMARLNPLPSGGKRAPEKLCSGQTLFCRSLGLLVADWDSRLVGEWPLFLLDMDSRPSKIVRTTRLGISPARDAHLPYRFIDFDNAAHSTRNPMGRNKKEGEDYDLLFPLEESDGTSPTEVN